MIVQSASIELRRSTWVEIDLEALAQNVRQLRNLVGPIVNFYAVCKGDAYGVGIEAFARTAIAAGADALATSDPSDLSRIRSAGVHAPVLVYPATTPDQAAELAALGAIVSLHDLPSVHAFVALGQPIEVFVKLDCGFSRLGLPREQWVEAFQILAGTTHVRTVGLYTHLGHNEDRERVQSQVATFCEAAKQATVVGLRDLQRMVASSRIAIGYPEARFNAVNPGRALYGILEPPWTARLTTRQVIVAVKARVIQVKTLAAGTQVAYATRGTLEESRRIAVIPTGFADGLPRLPEGGTVLVHGRRAAVLGFRSTEHTVIDVGEIDGVEVGDEVVLLGRQGDEEITAAELCTETGIPLIELLPRLGRGFQRLYLS